MASVFRAGSCSLVIAFMFIITARAKQYNECEKVVIKQCNENFKAHFVDIPPEKKVYCQAFEEYGSTLASSTCDGDFINLDRYMIYQHMTIDILAGNCSYTEESYGALRARVKAENKYKNRVDEIDSGIAIDTCCKDGHWKCSRMFDEALRRETSMSAAVNNFVACYDSFKKVFKCNEGKGKLCHHFVNTLDKVGKGLLKLFRETRTMS